MVTDVRASEPRSLALEPWRPGCWRLQAPRAAGIVMGMTDRTADASSLALALRVETLIQAEQVHGASIAAVEMSQPLINPIPGCDALITRLPGVALAMCTADCVPLIVWDPAQRAAGIAHVGWRGAQQRLPMRLIRALTHTLQSRPRDVWASVGPSIRSCCYEVGGEFVQRFGGWVRQREGRWRFDLAGYISEQLRAAGVPPAQVLDAGVCTACDTTQWYSVRKEGQGTGRLISAVMVRP